MPTAIDTGDQGRAAHRQDHGRPRGGQRRGRRRDVRLARRDDARGRAPIVPAPSDHAARAAVPPNAREARGARRRHDLGHRRAQHRLGDDERPHHARSPATCSRTARPARRRRCSSAPRSGGVWKSLDGGTTFKPVFDKMPVQSIGAITIDPTSNGKTIWVGTGEAWTRNSVSIGDGIYKSTDGGETWNNMGLPDVGAHRAHPRPPDATATSCTRACPASCGATARTAASTRRTDGGKTWYRSLSRARTCRPGCSSLAMDPTNPDVLLAGTVGLPAQGVDVPLAAATVPTRRAAAASTARPTAARRGPPITTSRGLPPGPWGRVEVVDRAERRASRLRARSSRRRRRCTARLDGGTTWEQRDNSQTMVWRPFYFARLVVDPTNPSRAVQARLGADRERGRRARASRTPAAARTATGTTSGSIRRTPSTSIGGDDGGLWTSYDGGSRWWKSNNLPISQFYHVSVDDKDPYRSTAASRTTARGSATRRTRAASRTRAGRTCTAATASGRSPTRTTPTRSTPRAQGGYIGRIDRRTLAGARHPAEGRLQGEAALQLERADSCASPTQKGTIYLGAQFLFRSRDRGETWERISPDLTTNDPEKQKQEQSGGVTVDNSSAEMHTTIYSIRESPKATRARSGSAPTTATSSSRATPARTGRTSSATCPTCRRRRG